MSDSSPTVTDKNVNKLVYDGKPGTIYKIIFAFIFFNIITLGIYSFWGRVKMRQYMVSSLSLLGERFQFSGEVTDLYKGFIYAIPIALVVYSPFLFWNQKYYPYLSIMIIPILFTIWVGKYAAIGYRLSRTHWKGIRGSLTGSPFYYASLRLKNLFINIITLGYYIPFADIKNKAYIIENIHCGSEKMTFNANPKELVRINIITLILMLPSLGFSRAWYNAALVRHIYKSVKIDGLSIEGVQTITNIILLIIPNILISGLTLGIGLPYAIHRNMKYFADNLIIKGDLEAFVQAQSLKREQNINSTDNQTI